MKIKTSAGTICVYRNTNPDAPGCTVRFVPNGTDYELDIAYVEVKENPSYCFNGETEKDVCIYVCADPYTENTTDKFIIKRNDIVKALEIEEV